MMNEIDKMVLALKKIKKGFVIFYETPSEATPANFKVFDNVFDAFNFASENRFLKGFRAGNNCWAVYESLDALKQICECQRIINEDLAEYKFLGLKREI
ncbi:hypothetical protein [Campylobacter concisus]|nr:hypothetical protein [Campylobacter concisus]